ncbi:hypothetical protein J7L60_03080 [Candidatus Bathyarchaeota archaeon]|nr:hypothetical protein [Candidatus Bathyarchaeota archaeon]
MVCPAGRGGPALPASPRGRGTLDEEAISILKALASFNEPFGCARIAERAGLPTRKVTGKLRGFLNKGLVERPEKGSTGSPKRGGRPYLDPLSPLRRGRP